MAGRPSHRRTPLADIFLTAVRQPPAAVVQERQRIQARAASLVEAMTSPALPASLDCVVAGSGFLSLYFLGVHSVLTALQKAGRLAVERYAGASSGAQTPFEIVLAGEDATLDTYLAHGLTADEHVPNASLVRSALNADRHWHKLGDWLIDSHADSLHRLDGRVFVSVSMLSWTGLRNVIFSQYSTAGVGFCKEAYYATGTLLTRCNGGWATDGGVTNNKPLFSDRARPQLLVQPTKSGLPLTMAMRYSFAQAVAAIERGQDEAIAFFSGSSSPPPAALQLIAATASHEPEKTCL